MAEMDGAQHKQGFTIVELLIVVVVIAILAAITIVAYNGIQNRSLESSIQADLRNSFGKLKEYRALNEAYPVQTDSALDAVGFKVARSLYTEASVNYLYCANTDRSLAGFIVVGRNGTVYRQTSEGTFGRYTGSYPINDWNNLCSELVGSSLYPRYGFAPATDGWRYWTE